MSISNRIPAVLAASKVVLAGLVATLVCAAVSPAGAAPLGLPDAPLNEQMGASDELIRLGKKLFNDSRLSASARVSCAKCHLASHAFSDRRATAVGDPGQRGTRNTPTLLNVAYERELFWDGRSDSLEHQVRSPLFNPLEQGLRDAQTLEALINSLADYPSLFRSAFGRAGSSITTDQVAEAIAAYERTLVSADSPFDRFLYGHDIHALSDRAQNGLALFKGRAGCAECHTIGKSSAIFSDRQFHSSSVRLSPQVLRDLAGLTSHVMSLRRPEDATTLNDLVGSDKEIAALGRFVVSGDPADIGRFRTPSLRNVALTAPYMHDGSVPTLELAVEVELYSRGVAVEKPIILTVSERGDIVEFLRSLNGAGGTGTLEPRKPAL